MSEMKQCECGGKVEHTSGPLGYESFVCSVCDYHWRPDKEVPMEEQVYCYRKARDARELWSECKDEVSFDDDPVVSKAEDGAWVAAWVWVPDQQEESLLSRTVDRALSASGVVNSRKEPQE